MNQYWERDDLSLIVRSFDPNIKARLIGIQNQNMENSLKTMKAQKKRQDSKKFNFESTLNDLQETVKNIEIDQTHESSLRKVSTILTNSDSEYDAQTVEERSNFIAKNIDENGLAIAYIDLEKEFYQIIREQGENPFEDFEKELKLMENNTKL